MRRRGGNVGGGGGKQHVLRCRAIGAERISPCHWWNAKGWTWWAVAAAIAVTVGAIVPEDGA